MEYIKYKLGDLITQRREKNSGERLPICGITRDGFIPPKQAEADTSIYNMFYKNDFVFNPARMELNSIVFNDVYDKAICSSLYEMFYVTKPEIILPEYLAIIVKTDWFTRYCDFLGNGSAREYCRVSNLGEMELSIPSINVQKEIVKKYTLIKNRINILNKENEQILQIIYNFHNKMFYKKDKNSLFGNIIYENKKSNIQVGAIDNGIYPFFTSGENILKHSKFLVDGINLFINTGGNFDIKIFNGKASYSTDSWCIFGKNEMSYYIFNTLSQKKNILHELYFHGSALKHLQKDEIKNMEIYEPTTEEIKDYNSKVEAFFNMINLNNKEIELLTIIKKNLLFMQ